MRKRAESRKAGIVATILDLADPIGPDRVTTGSAATTIGVTRAAVFRHFPTKAALWPAVADHVAQRLTGAWDAALGENCVPVARFRALIAAHFDRITATAALPMLLFSRPLTVENDALRKGFRDRPMAFQAHLVREIAAARQGGALRGAVAAPDVAMLLTTLVQGMAIRWTLRVRDFVRRDEGLRLVNVRLQLMTDGGP